VFFIDELDLGHNGLLASLNTALAGKGAGFPCGYIAKHKGFVCVGAGNTPMLGATMQFSSRNAQDGALRDRFRFIEWNTDKTLEMHIAKQNFERAEPWVKWVQNVRELAKTAYPKLTCTARASIEGAFDLACGETVSLVANMHVFRGIDAGSVRAILNTYPLPTF
jgi:hypothetical protein